tara:strand:+ start:3159 stop:3806 length:648 start_codon:yes stop_codon:yes gene_type:complete
MGSRRVSRTRRTIHIGYRHNLNCDVCDVSLTQDNTYKDCLYACKECFKKEQKVRDKINAPIKNPKNNPLRMYVDGTYVSRTHPLYKPGRYKTFNDAAFSSLVNYVTAVEGEVYILANPAWKNWYKIGKAVDARDRWNSYQTSSPHRDYVLITSKLVKNRGVAEKMAHSLAESLSRKRANEWFYIENVGKEGFDRMLGLIDGLIEEKIRNDRTSTN